ncbi:testis-specific y-encoded like protein [Babesia gibsoni]|uniref:Testis-specific y-encoded like protein n=1 Tax=Babesia gibsoni TaxID=33632 RepID=A0AAD8PDS9_BABGI|nr:testis-specific y-encoded like protein [Babesia gibsoni]
MKRTFDDPSGGGAHGDAGETQVLLPHINDFDAVQKKLLEIDEECSNKQIELQREYDKKKQPHFRKRQEIIDKIPGFWAKAITHHPALSYLTTADMPILELLRQIDLEDNLDNSGSYKVTLTFGDAAREYMDTLVLTKHMEFTDTKERVVECTKIHWKAGKSPVDVAVKARTDDRCIDWSLFEWFTEDEWVNRPDFGEILRRELWHAPLAYYLDTVSVDFLDEEYDMMDEDDDEE